MTYFFQHLLISNLGIIKIHVYFLRTFKCSQIVDDIVNIFAIGLSKGLYRLEGIEVIRTFLGVSVLESHNAENILRGNIDVLESAVLVIFAVLDFYLSTKTFVKRS